MQDKKTKDQSKEIQEKQHSATESSQEQKPLPEKTEVKNAHAAGLGAIGRTGEKPGQDIDENMHY